MKLSSFLSSILLSSLVADLNIPIPKLNPTFRLGKTRQIRDRNRSAPGSSRLLVNSHLTASPRYRTSGTSLFCLYIAASTKAQLKVNQGFNPESSTTLNV